jgi:uncharacterized protein HemX
MRLRFFGETLLLAIAIACAAGWYWQHQHDQQKLAGVDVRAVADAEQINELQAKIDELEMQAKITKLDAVREIQELRKQMVEMQAAFRRQPIGRLIMHFYPRDNSID